MEHEYVCGGEMPLDVRLRSKVHVDLLIEKLIEDCFDASMVGVHWNSPLVRLT